MKRNIIFSTLLLVALFLAANANLLAVDSHNKEIKIKTSAICETCKAKIEKSIIRADGVNKAVLDVKTKILTIDYNTTKTDPTKLKKLINLIGYDADETKADTKAYNNLPKCCKKD